MISQISSKCVYRKFSLWWVMHHLARMEPPRETMPVRRWVVRWMKGRRTPAWMVK